MSPTAPSLARTYSDREYSDPWEKVLDYRRVREYAADHPKHGRTRVGNALDLPPSRVRGWLNGGMPDPVRGVQTAIDHGWIDPDPDGDVAAALVELLAHVLAGGSITSRTFVPAVTTGRRVGLEEVRDAFERVGVETVVRRADDENRATEVIPTADGSVLGRCLVTMGAPAGEKIALDSFPSIVWEVPRAVRESFARIYVDHRGTGYSEKQTMAIQEERSAEYLEGLRGLLADVTGQPVTAGGRQVTISAAAVRELGAA
ncbi:hypothetical protein [Halorubrum aethiopicum]|uniref:hypothetical protein n=1 Tax=Halorubrum aethiopicum TaxID=1758255 RepID=UPI0008303EBD|nr:hypothetical protein [Halorubrum aethiopicum]